MANSLLSMKINSNATSQMEKLMDKVNTFPNRISSIQQSSLASSIQPLYNYMFQLSDAAKYIDFELEESGRLGYRLKISPTGSRGTKDYYAGSTMIGGRKGGMRIRPKVKKYMKFREGSVQQGYTDKPVKEVRLGRMPDNRAKIRNESRQILLRNVEKYAKIYGFGPRGGATGLTEDIPRIRVRSR